jgi:putative transposase
MSYKSIINYHVVICPKYRQHYFTPEMMWYFQSLFSDRDFIKNKFSIIECNGGSDHLHLLLSAKPSISVSLIINLVKTKISKFMKSEFCEDSFQFSGGYFVSSVGGADFHTVKNYINNQ